ncbi:recombination protein NinB [Fimbriiglobus ruber]|uniref:NinB protein n=1 Tax=Fimbriiglobus ruber TaxID=1908690 RepID=A0A225DBX2_9BACT|nr:recombination protein NinB [Fimbriiglobus ruber]OWK34649.1 hypothetical protein FRUB_10620 [Fimbriiglobus ruber]
MSDVLELPFMAADGRIPSSVWERLGDTVSRLPGKRFVITLKEVKRKRSVSQNAYYWGVVIAEITKMFRDHGNYVDGEDVHEFLKLRVAKLSRMIVTPDGEVHKSLGSTTKLSTMEFEVYLERVRAWAAEYGCIIPLPNEQVS